jgi:hypothetical protein
MGDLLGIYCCSHLSYPARFVNKSPVIVSVLPSRSTNRGPGRSVDRWGVCCSFMICWLLVLFVVSCLANRLVWCFADSHLFLEVNLQYNNLSIVFSNA